MEMSDSVLTALESMDNLYELKALAEVFQSCSPDFAVRFGGYASCWGQAKKILDKATQKLTRSKEQVRI